LIASNEGLRINGVNNPRNNAERRTMMSIDSLFIYSGTPLISG
jgi:hypothetical protein